MCIIELLNGSTLFWSTAVKLYYSKAEAQLDDPISGDETTTPLDPEKSFYKTLKASSKINS